MVKTYQEVGLCTLHTTRTVWTLIPLPGTLYFNGERTSAIYWAKRGERSITFTERTSQRRLGEVVLIAAKGARLTLLQFHGHVYEFNYSVAERGQVLWRQAERTIYIGREPNPWDVGRAVCLALEHLTVDYALDVARRCAEMEVA